MGLFFFFFFLFSSFHFRLVCYKRVISCACFFPSTLRSLKVKSEEDQPLDSSMLSANKSLTPVSDVPFEDDLEAERQQERERREEAGEGGRHRERERPRERAGGERESLGHREEEGKRRSRSPTPIARPRRKVITPSRCYMDEEGGKGRQREREKKGDR